MILLIVPVSGMSHAFSLNPHLLKAVALTVFGGALCALAVKRFNLVFWLAGLAIALLVGAGLCFQNWAHQQEFTGALPETEYVSISGTLIDFPHFSGTESTCTLIAHSISWRTEEKKVKLGVRLKVTGDLSEFNRGDQVRVEARLRRPPSRRNFTPAQLDNYVIYRKLNYFAYSKSALLVVLEKEAPWYWRWLGYWRASVRKALTAIAETKSDLKINGRAFLQAVLLGDRSLVDPVLKESLLLAGVFHLLAISGAHIGALAVIFLFLGKTFQLPRRIRFLLAGLLLILYLALSGFTISAQRAVLVALVFFTARIFDYQSDPANVLSFAALLLLILNPGQLLDPGFALTFILAAAILAGRKLLLPLLENFPRPVAELISANCSAFLASSFLSLYFFNRFSLAGFFSGLLLVPLGGILVALAVPLLFLAPTCSYLASLYVVFLSQPLAVFFKLVDLFAGLEWQIYRPALPFMLITTAFTALFLGTLERFRGWPRRSFLALFFALFLLQTIGLPAYRPQNPEIVFLDVGQGDAALLTFPGGKTLLVDGGGAAFSDFEVGRNIVLPYVMRRRLRINWVAVSHYHADHAEGVSEILAALKPEELWLSSRIENDFYFRQIRQKTPANTRVIPIQAGFKRSVGDYEIRCLFPEKFIFAEKTRNDDSQVLQIRGPGLDLLFCGDIEKQAEEKLIGLYGDDLKSDIIKVPHHGSRSSSSPEFLALVKPRLAIISLSEHNPFSFPHREVLENYRRIGSQIVLTSRSGGFRIKVNDQALLMETSK